MSQKLPAAVWFRGLRVVVVLRFRLSFLCGGLLESDPTLDQTPDSRFSDALSWGFAPNDPLDKFHFWGASFPKNPIPGFQRLRSKTFGDQTPGFPKKYHPKNSGVGF